MLKGTLIDKLDKEEREAMIAKNKYDFACKELEFCLKEIEIYADRVKDKFAVDREYSEFIRQMKKYY